MVSAAVPPPVVKVVVVTVAVHAAAVVPRLSVTVVVPSCALVAPPPDEAAGRAAVAGTVMASSPAVMVMEVALVAVWVPASVILMVKLEVPAAAGVPAMTPVDAFRVRPAGRVPALTDQVYGVVPPAAVSVSA